MKSKRFLRFYLLSCLGVILAALYPLIMGIRTVADMWQSGAVPIERYPKYIIPYAPIAVALILGTVLMPVFYKLFKRFAFVTAAVFSTGVFFLIERLMETKILVCSQEVVNLESWQMSLCYVPPEMYKTRTWEAVDVLLGGYNPAFKLHFYLISVILVVSILNCLYGFAKMICSGDRTRQKALTIQAATSTAFLGMCIWACFTAFYRTGELIVPTVSAVLMAVFFVLFGMTAGIFTGSFTLNKPKGWSVWLPTGVSVLTTLAMYIGEMILLSGNVYRFGKGVLFDGIPLLVLAPVDMVCILLSGCATGLLCALINRHQCAKQK